MFKIFIKICIFIILFSNNLLLFSKGFLSISNKKIIDETGKEIYLKGVNLGGWLLIEPWLIKFNNQQGIRSEKDIWDMMEKRFGTEKMKELIHTYRDNFITAEDIKYIKSLGMNCIRVPFWWRVLSDTKYSGRGFAYLDNVIKWCSENEIYCILDMHGAPGGQNTGADILGEREVNKFWSDKKYQNQTIQLWKKIAERYKNNPTVVGYDLLNEAWSVPDFQTLIEMYDKLIKEIRKIDKKHLIFIEDALKGYHRLQACETKKWKNVVYSIHYYPRKLYDSHNAESLFFPNIRHAEKIFTSPVHIGEFNTIWNTWGGVDMMGRFIKIFNQYGWHWTMWTYKKIENNKSVNWQIIGSIKHLKNPNLRSASFDEIKETFKNYHTSKLGKNEDLINAIKRSIHTVYVKRKQVKDFNNIKLYPEEAYLLRKENGSIKMEWDDLQIGYWSEGDSVFWHFDNLKENTYIVILKYSSPSSGSKMALYIDDVLYKEFVIKSTDGWADYKGMEIGNIKLPQGKHKLQIKARSKKYDFIKLKEVSLEKIEEYDEESILFPILSKVVQLTPFNITEYKRKSEICVEWQNTPSNIGSIKTGDGLVWQFKVIEKGYYNILINCSAKIGGSKLNFFIDRKNFTTFSIPSTGAWHNYKEIIIGKEYLKKGIHTLSFTTLPHKLEGSGNIRSIKLIPIK